MPACEIGLTSGDVNGNDNSSFVYQLPSAKVVMAIGIVMCVNCLVACKRRLSSGDDDGDETIVCVRCLVSYCKLYLAIAMVIM